MALKGNEADVQSGTTEEVGKAVKTKKIKIEKKPGKNKKKQAAGKTHPLTGRKRTKASIQRYKETMAAKREAIAKGEISPRGKKPTLATMKKLGPIAMLRESEQVWYDRLEGGHYGKKRRLPWEIANAIAALRMMEGGGPE